MKTIKLILISVVLFSCTGNVCDCPFTATKEKVSRPDTMPITVVVSKVIVSQTGLFGFVGKGSCVFDYSNAVDGYCIKEMKGDRVLSTTFTDPQHLDLWKRRLKNELEKDSTLFTITNKK